MIRFIHQIRCIYGNDIPCYTQYNDVIPIDRRHIRHDTPSNVCYMNGIQRITSLSDRYTSIVPHRTPPHTLGDALYYTIDDILRPIRSYITSTQLICVVFMHVILSISIYWRLYNDSFDFINTYNNATILLVVLVYPIYTDAMVYVIHLLSNEYVIPRCYTRVICYIPSRFEGISLVYTVLYVFRVTEHMNTYVIPFVFKCYLVGIYSTTILCTFANTSVYRLYNGTTNT